MNLRAVPMALIGLLLAAACGTKLYVASPSGSSTPIAGLPSSNPPTALGTPFELSGELFFAQFGAVPPPYHVSLATTLSGSPSGVAVTEADANGADYRAALHVEITGAPRQDSQIVVFDGTGYVADAGSTEWRAYPDYETIPPVNPFLSLDPSQWTELGADPIHGGLDHMHSTTWRLPPDSSLVDRVEDVQFDLWLDGGGLPVTAELSLNLPALDRTSVVGYQATYTFSRIGEPVVIAPPIAGPSEVGSVDFRLISSAFSEGGAIPRQYTCDGADSQLAVSWSGLPAGTVELALIMDDPDARGFVHWVVVTIPAAVAALTDPLPAGVGQGRNDFGEARYRGPCPPSGTHNYVLTLYALSAPLGLAGQPTAAAVRSAAQGKTIATAVLRGTYRRS